MLTYLTASLFESPAQAIVNTVNVVGVMGKGIALQFKKLYPAMYTDYRKLCNAGRLTIGQLHVYRTANKIVVNFPTKKNWRQPSSPDYIEAGLQVFCKTYGDYGINSVAFPQLGCGNGELNWDTQVKPLMEKFLKTLPIPVYIHLYKTPQGFIPERLDKNYRQQLLIERIQVSASKAWNDLEKLTESHDLLSIKNDHIHVSDDFIHLRSASEPGIEKTIYREDFENLWNILRIRGTVSCHDIAQNIIDSGVASQLFDFMEKLDYVKPISVLPIDKKTSCRGLQYSPGPTTQKAVTLEAIL